MRLWPVALIPGGLIRVAGYLMTAIHDLRERDDDHGVGGIMLSANLLGHNSFILIPGQILVLDPAGLHRGPVVEAYTHGLKTASARTHLSGRDHGYDLDRRRRTGCEFRR